MTCLTVKSRFKFCVSLVMLSLMTFCLPISADTNAAGIELTIEDDANVNPLRISNIVTNTADSKSTEPVFAFKKDSAKSGANSVGNNEKPSIDKSKDVLAVDPKINIDNSDIKSSSVEMRQRIIDGYAMENLASTRTAEHEAWYAKRPDYMKRMIERSQKYLYFIVGEVEKRGMPTEIALLPMIESAFNPKANSTSRAAGIWQFIPSTGKDFGLEQTWWKDNRRNVTAATNAALNYLQKLHGMFGSWELALAAYNAGEGTVQRAINHNQKLGLPTDYTSLNLPIETQHYVPKLQAIKNIMTNPEEFGLDIAPINNAPYFAKVSAPDRIDAKLAANLAGISMDEFSALNPEYKRPVLSGTENSHDILLPIDAVTTFKTNLASYDKPLVSWQTYKAKRGENIIKVAQKFGMNVGELREVNQLSTKSKLNTNMSLLVSNNGLTQNNEIVETNFKDNNEAPSAELKTNKSELNQQYVVKKHETLNSIAKKYGITVAALKAENAIHNNRLKLGQSLEIPVKHVVLAGNSRTNAKISHHKYTVKRGDTLAEIAVKFDVTSNDIKRWNKLKNSTIQPGRNLIIVRS